MSASPYPSVVAYSQKGSIGSSGNTSPSSPKSDTTSGSHRFILHGKSSQTQSQSESQSDRQTPIESGVTNLGGIPPQGEPPLDEGWPLLARLMDKNPEFEAFARFRELNVKNLLYYQVELDYVSDLLRREELRDRKLAHMDEKRAFSQCPLKMIKKFEDDGKCKQWEYVLRMRRCLREYNEAMLQYTRVSALPEANAREMNMLVDWIVNPQGGNHTISSWGSGAWGWLYDWQESKMSLSDLLRRLWKGLKDVLLFWRARKSAPQTRSDLVVLRPGVKADGVATWIAYTFVPWLSEFVLVIRGRGPQDLYSGPRDVSLCARPGVVSGLDWIPAADGGLYLRQTSRPSVWDPSTRSRPWLPRPLPVCSLPSPSPS
jgi:hypothetical protein